MKKILLVKPKDEYSYAVIPSLGLGYLAASLRKKGFEPHIMDLNKPGLGVAAFEKYMAEHSFPVVGLQVYTSSIRSANEVAAISRRVNKDAVIIAGGPHPSGDPEHALRSIPDADCLVVGEGENAVAAIAMLSRKDMPFALEGIKNTAFRGPDGKIVVGPLETIEDLEDVPMPAWDLIDPRTYGISPHGTFSRSYPVAPIITSRGCPYACTFCAAFRIFGRKVRRRTVGSVLDEISFLRNEYGVREFHIEDDNFTIEKDYVMRFCKGIKERSLEIWWACPNGIRIDKVDAEMLAAMESSGCYSVALGIESGSSRVLGMMRKSLRAEDMGAMVDMIKRNSRMSVTGFFLIGYPGETVDDIKKTLKLSRKLKLDKASFSPVMPLPGSQIYGEWKKRLGGRAVSWDKFLYYQIVPFVSDIQPALLSKYLKKAVVGFYMRPRVILGLLREIKTQDQIKALFKRAWTIFFGSTLARGADGGEKMLKKYKRYLYPVKAFGGWVSASFAGALVRMANGGRIGRYIKSHDVKKLHIGAGSNMLEGWCNTDINPKISGGVFLDARRRFPFADGTFDYIFSEHMLEHLELKDGIRMLGECFRILTPGGKIRISTPDLRYLIELYNSSKTDVQKREITRIVDMIFPDVAIYQDTFVINNFFRSWGHKFIYDYKVLKELMSRAGFTDIVNCGVGESADENLRSLESHGKHVSDEINKLQTFVAEGLKPYA